MKLPGLLENLENLEITWDFVHFPSKNYFLSIIGSHVTVLLFFRVFFLIRIVVSVKKTPGI